MNAAPNTLPPSDKGVEADRSSAVSPNNGRREGGGGKALPLVLAAVLAAAAGGGWYYWDARDVVTTDDAQIGGDTVTIAPKVAGEIVEIAAKDNQRVKKGDLLVKIDPRDFIAARDKSKGNLALAQAGLANQQQNLDMTKVSAPAKLEQAKAQVDSAQANQDLAEANMKREFRLTDLATTQQNKDQVSANFRAAKAATDQAKANVKIAALVAENIAEAQAKLDQAKGQVAQSEAELKTAELNLSYTEVRAPQDGYVAHRVAQIGNNVTADQALMGLVSSNIWVNANFKENQLDRMRVGDAATIKVDAYPGLTLKGHVEGFQQGTGSAFSAMPAENATGNFVKIVQRVPVKIVIDSGLKPDLPLPIGLSVVPTVTVK